MWSVDFMHDQLEDGRSFRLLNVIDDYNREALGMEIDFSLPAERVIRALQQIIEGGASLWPFVATTAPSTSAKRCRLGRRRWASSWNTPSQACRSKMPMWSASTSPCAMNGYRSTAGKICRRFSSTPLSGYGNTITNAQIWPWAASPLSSDWPWLHNPSIFRIDGKWGDYRAKYGKHIA